MLAMAHRTKLTIRAREKFLEHLAKTANVTESAKLIGMARNSMYDARDRDESLRQAWDEAIEIATDALEKEARRRALQGWDEPVFYRGEQVGKMRIYSDRMLELLLKAHRPYKFKETVRQELTDGAGNPLQPLVQVYLPSKDRIDGDVHHNGHMSQAREHES
jgi:hypothetical protein